MWEAYNLENEDFLWAGIPFQGGIGGYQNAPCGVVSASALCLGLRHRHPMSESKRAKQARNTISYLSGKIVADFNSHFGDITCQDLIGMDFSIPGEYQKFLDSGIWKEKCVKYVEFMVEKLFEFEDNQGLFVQSP